MKLIKNDKFEQINEYGELIPDKKQPKMKTVDFWQVRFFKAMVVFLLITLTLLAFIN